LLTANANAPPEAKTELIESMKVMYSNDLRLLDEGQKRLLAATVKCMGGEFANLLITDSTDANGVNER